MMERVQLKAVKREKTGKSYAKKLRMKEWIPCIVYGGKVKPTMIEVLEREFLHLLRTGAGENVVIDLKIEGGTGKKHTVLVKELQRDPVSGQIQHIDFNAISLTEKIRVKVPLHDKGESPGVKEGGILDHVHHEVEVECLPTEIPQRIDVSIDGLNIGDAILIKDLVFPPGVVCIAEPDDVALTVHPPAKEEEVVPVGEEEAQAEPEVIKKGKVEEEVPAPEKGAEPKKEAKKEAKKEEKGKE